MKQGLLRVALAAFFFSLFAYVGSAQQLAMTVDATKTGAPLSPYMYGYFTELLGNNEGGFWSEMLGDRKFFYAVDSSKDLPGPAPRARRRPVARWRPVGPDEFVVMDRDHAFVGEHSPMIKLEADTPHGIQQGELGLEKGNKYSVRMFIGV
jgi:alpha-N-arabinofuranosidase